MYGLILVTKDTLHLNKYPYLTDNLIHLDTKQLLDQLCLHMQISFTKSI